MRAISLLCSPSGRLKPQPFIYGAIAVYLLGAASQLLTTPDILRRGGLLPFVAAQLALIWIWFCLHAKRLHDAGRSSGLAVGIALLYLLSVVLLLIVVDGFFTTADMPLGQRERRRRIADPLHFQRARWIGANTISPGSSSAS